MSIISVTDYGADCSGAADSAAAVQQAFDSAVSGDSIYFPPGRYLLNRRVKCENLERITVYGSEAVLTVHFCRTCFDGLDGAFLFSGCRCLILRNLEFDYDVSPNSAAAVTRVDEKTGTFDLRIDEEFDFTGGEIISSVMSMDSDGSPDYDIETYSRCVYTMPEKNLLHISAAESAIDIKRVYTGQRIALRHTIYGAPLVIFTGVDTCIVQDVTVWNSAGLTYLINPRSRNFSFIRSHIILPSGTKRLLASNADGIHIVGLVGRLSICNCRFEQLGDDALNIHSKAGTVQTVNQKSGSARVYYKRTNRALAPEWAEAGDILYIHSSRSFLPKGTLRVISFKRRRLVYELLSGKLSKGDVLSNSAFYAETLVTGCTVKNTRARGLLLQTHNVTVENCSFYGISLAAILMSPDIAYWYEVGPSENVTIKNNRIEKCAFVRHPSNLAAVIVKCSHENYGRLYPVGVHKNITIAGNSFESIGDSAVYANAVQGVTVKDNGFNNCCKLPFDNKKRSLKYDIALLRCSDITIDGNSSTNAEERLLYGGKAAARKV